MGIKLLWTNHFVDVYDMVQKHKSVIFSDIRFIVPYDNEARKQNINKYFYLVLNSG